MSQYVLMGFNEGGAASEKYVVLCFGGWSGCKAFSCSWSWFRRLDSSFMTNRAPLYLTFLTTLLGFLNFSAVAKMSMYRLSVSSSLCVILLAVFGCRAPSSSLFPFCPGLNPAGKKGK